MGTEGPCGGQAGLSPPSRDIFKGHASQEAGNERKSELINGAQAACLGEKRESGGRPWGLVFPSGIPADIDREE